MSKHWVDEVTRKILEERDDKKEYVLNWGMSLSGRMHIGNLRELSTVKAVRKALEEKGKEVKNIGVFYTQDRFKGKAGQLGHFDGDGKKYIGWRLVDVPDPDGCHRNWPEHFNSENEPYFKKFGLESRPITTTEFYKMDETKKLVKRFLSNRENVRDILNRFRDREPYPDDWIPFDPLCQNCKRIDKTKAIDVDLEKEQVKYSCSACGDKGWSKLENGKLTWRLEWCTLWDVLNVDFEPYGKDHATPGGSRDSCVALCKEFDLNYPVGFAYNWVYWKENGDISEMTSSGNIGLTAKDFVEYAEPEVLTYLYLSTKPMKEIYFNPLEIPTYVRRFDRSEAIYFGKEEARSEKRGENIKRNYELAVRNIPKKKPERISYSTCTFVAQLSDDEEKVLELLNRTVDLPEKLGKGEMGRIMSRIKRSRNWISTFKPDNHLIEVKEDVSDVEEALGEEQKKALRKLREELEKKNWSSDELQDRIYEMKDEFGMGTGDLFQGIYLAILGKKSGPRAGQLIKAVGQKRVSRILKKI